MTHPFEALGTFYLGRVVDAGTRQPTDDLLLYDAKDLTTHAVCVGMTGSGKTGLCIALLEEAAIDGIPALVIDPKGDLTNLALRFPDLDAASFRPWINEDAARQLGMTPDAFAAREAAKWTAGLAESGQDAERIARLCAAADVVVYTPGSDAGTPVSVLSSLAPPHAAVTASPEALAEHASGVVSSLVALLGIDADPVRSREHILLTTILQDAWIHGRPLDLAGLVHAVQSPPVARIGVMELESFYPAKERFELAMAINGLLAAPAFQSWLAGEPIDIDRMLYSQAGTPRVAVFSIAHLDDAARMFFVSLLLNEVVAWMRTRSGTSSLGALVYMDEIFGFMPPVENPPSKKPLLTLLKQARAFGVGVVVATQNPVDLDYKALSNAGTWFVGRLQTERDKQRLADGLAAASPAASLSPDALADIIGALEPRTFLLHNVHEAAPVLFSTRWVMSYLAGPLTREQIRRLPGARAGAAPAAPVTPAAAPRAPVAAGGARPVLPEDLPQAFEAGTGAVSVYAPFVLGEARVHLSLPDGSPFTGTVVRVAPLAADAAGPDWTAAEAREGAPPTSDAADPQATFAGLPRAAGKAGAVKAWTRSFTDAVYRAPGLTLRESKRLRLVSRPGESERDFRIRVADAARADRDAQVETLREKYATRLASLEGRIRRAEQAVAREKDQANSRRVHSAVSLGTTLLGALIGRKALSSATLGRAATTARGFDRAAREARDVDRAEDSLETLVAERDEMTRALAADVAALEARLAAGAEPLVDVIVRPRKTDIEVTRVALLWRPS